jgi:hypothetical protein
MLERSPKFEGKKEIGDEWLQGLFQRGSLGEFQVAGPNKHSPCHIVFESMG